MASVTILSDNGATSGSAGLKTSGGNDGVLLLQTTTSGGTPTTAISIDNTQTVTFTNQPTYTGGTANGVLYLNGSKAVTSGTALVFDGTNLGIGVTPSAWNSDYKSVAVSNYAEFYGRVATPSVGVSYNVYRNSGGSFIYKTSNAAARYEQDSGYHLWYTAGSGTAGATASFTQVMTLDASGNLGIGTTNPTEKLEVNGAVKVANSITIGSNGTYAAGSIYSDGNWGMIFRAKQASPAQAQFLWMNSSDSEVLRVNNSNNLILSGGTTSANGVGITFPATQSASTNANTLDDYEEGTWTPTLSTSGGGFSATYSSQSGTYVKVGRLVTVWANLVVGTKSSSGSGYLILTGLPFEIASGPAEFGGAVGMSYLWASNPCICIQPTPGTTTAILNSTFTNVNCSGADVQNGSYFRCSITYQALA